MHIHIHIAICQYIISDFNLRILLRHIELSHDSSLLIAVSRLSLNALQHHILASFTPCSATFLRAISHIIIGDTTPEVWLQACYKHLLTIILQ